MKKALRIIIKWLFRLLLGIISLVILVMLLFFIFQGKIVNRTIGYLNEMQPGEVKLESMNLRSFMHFPDVSVKLNSLEFFEATQGSDTANSRPVLALDEFSVALDLVQLIKGNYKISRIDLGDGEVYFNIGADSISNIERALGISFSDSPSDTVKSDTSVFSFDLELLQIRNLKIQYSDIPGKTNVKLNINRLQSGFSYWPDTIRASLRMHIDISEASYQDIQLDKPRSVSFSTSMIYDQVHDVIDLDKSMLDITDAVFELDGNIRLREHMINMDFSARNTGIDLLNFLLSGILKVEAIEQIGEGKMQLNGNVNGSFKDELPLVEANFIAEEMGFRINTIGQEIKDIRFTGYATNGTKKDLSESELRLQDFHVAFPDGFLDLDLDVSDLTDPTVALRLDGEADLAIVEEIIETGSIENLKGKVYLKGDIDGKIDKSQGIFLDNAGELEITMQDVHFMTPGNAINDLNGELYIAGKDVGLRNVNVLVDGSRIKLETRVDNLLPYLMGFSVNPFVTLIASSDELDLNRIIGDTITDGHIKDLAFRADIQAAAKEIEEFIEHGNIPRMDLVIQNMQFTYPGYAHVSDVKMLVYLDERDVSLSRFRGRIGGSRLELDLDLKNYVAFLESDSAGVIEMAIDLEADRLRARDLFTFNDEFTILPPEFIDEEMYDLKFKGKVKSTVGDLLSDNALPNFSFVTDVFFWDLKMYPSSFRNFKIDIENRDSLILVNHLQGSIGESNFAVQAAITNLLDSGKAIAGNVDIVSDLLDIDRLLDYELLSSGEQAPGEDTIAIDTISGNSANLHAIDLPDVTLNLDVDAFRFEGNELFGINGRLRFKPYQIVYLDNFSLQSKTGGTVAMDGQLNLIDSAMYTLSAKLAIDTMNVSDFNVRIAIEDTLYTLEENFKGILTADAIGEFYLNPDLSVNLDTSTAMFNFKLEDAKVVELAPLHAIARFTGNKDLDYIEGEVKNDRSITLSDRMFQIPLMSISSTLGLILLEGEQGLDGRMLYLVRVPTSLIRGTAWNVLSNQQRKQPSEEEEVQSMGEIQQFAKVTVYSKGEEFDVKIGDKREQYE
ncbi:MAG: hypothetical protein K9J30_02065 [Bacteroidales bacterium]|nr:hypothetical protein [Bacteroidales bacterium]